MLEDLMSKGSIHIYDYGIDRRRSMSSIGRSFPFYVMSYLSEGHAVLRLPDREIDLCPHSVIMIPPLLRHDHIMVREEASVFWWWHFDYKAYDTVDLLRLFHLIDRNNRRSLLPFQPVLFSLWRFPHEAAPKPYDEKGRRVARRREKRRRGRGALRVRRRVILFPLLQIGHGRPALRRPEGR